MEKKKKTKNPEKNQKNPPKTPENKIWIRQNEAK